MLNITVPSQVALRAQLDACAKELGLTILGVTSAEPFAEGAEAATSRLNDGFMADLPWYTQERIQRGKDPGVILPEARSVISIAAVYPSTRPAHASGKGRVARYAWGRDYHNVLKKRLKQLMTKLSENVGQPITHKVYVDDGPMLDREVAKRSGVGFFGKNTMILTQAGSWTFLGQVITDLELSPDAPSQKSCGTCTKCMPACPTGAIIAPYVIDSNRCISYLTIEHRGPIPRELRPLIADWMFGCDLCQEVCPVNDVRGDATHDDAFTPNPDWSSLDPVDVLALDEESFRAKFQGNPIRRATWEGLRRNACIVLGNLGEQNAIPALVAALQDASTLVRGHAAWALGRLGGTEAQTALESANEAETDPWVREELEAALETNTEP
ncbi:MAG: tRNA epoxyqueuosine(34) reductase QueG [SAR202 cluster bacterium]|nr:tRNA epoxyqueuosine(34) reductase QueG [SAR202 cluster bacterium]|tara:strand:+ start:754 stop:1905 length:1152 start_codon:yes stop_codon:yes gene_type:complete